MLMLQRQKEYFKNIFDLFKKIAFHQIYMQSAREDLCKDDFYDPKTAFKCLDAFKHNQIIPYELYSFLQLHEIQSTAQQCEQIIKCLNKSLRQLDFESFLQITMPKNSVLKNLSATRFDYVQIEVGSYSRLCYVKQHTQHMIALFLEKELNFSRQFLFLRQEFCRKWGGDIFSMFQKLFKHHKQSKNIDFSQFFSLSRDFGIIFNKNQFIAIWKRSKQIKVPVDHSIDNIYLNYDDLTNLLLVNNFNTKIKYGLQRNIPLEKMKQTIKPSYVKSHWRQYEDWHRKQKMREVQSIKEIAKRKPIELKYKYQYPQAVFGYDFKEKHIEWEQTVNKMNDFQLLNAYKKISTKSVLFNDQ